MAQTLAIVERLHGHTEDKGGFAALALELGFDVHLFFESGDRFHLIDYFRTRLPISTDHIHEWSEINDSALHFDVILLNTSFTWMDYGPQLQYWDTNTRLIVVHHHPEDIELNPYGERVFLTPAGGEDRWVFPLYSKPAASEPAVPESGFAPIGSQLPTLTSLGTFEGKDVSRALAYMKAGGRLVHYDRNRCGYFENADGLYTQHLGLDGVQLMKSLAGQNRPMFLWLPIVWPSDYMVCRFTAALIVGVEMNCVMVMPERLRKLYGFPQEAVIAYNTSVTEAHCLEKLRASSEKQLNRQRHLHGWAVERWYKNLAVFQALLGRPEA